MVFNCLILQEDSVVQHIACKIIENISSMSNSSGKRFLSSGGQQSGNGGEVIGALLWTIANRAPNENLKQSSMSVCKIRKLNYGII